MKTAEAKHTPGPWTAEQWHNDPAMAITAGEVWVADACGGTIDDDTRYANARLIAAAPELLEACKIVAEALRNQSREPGILPHLLQNVLVPAIAKAEGSAE